MPDLQLAANETKVNQPKKSANRVFINQVYYFNFGFAPK